jgi:hypothetical protein
MAAIARLYDHVNDLIEYYEILDSAEEDVMGYIQVLKAVRGCLLFMLRARTLDEEFNVIEHLVEILESPIFDAPSLQYFRTVAVETLQGHVVRSVQNEERAKSFVSGNRTRRGPKP